MIKQVLASIVILSLSGWVSAAVTLQTQQEIKVEEINGQAIKSGLIRSHSNQYQLNSGTNDLQVSYHQYFEAEDGVGAHDIVRSAPVFIKTPILQNNQTYKLVLMQVPKNNDEAKAFAKQPVFGLYDSQNQLLMTQVAAAQSRKSIVNAFFGDQQDNVTHQNRAQLQPEATYTPAAKITAKQQDTRETSASFNQLTNAWLNATQADRQKFMMWLAERSR